MKNEFIIKEGSLVFRDNKLEINDKKRWAWISNIALPIIIILNGFTNIYNYNQTKIDFQLWFGLFMIVLPILIMIFNRSRNYDRQIQFENIDKVIIKRDIMDMLIAIFITKTGKKRKVILDFDKYSLADFESSLKENNIIIEIE